MKKEDESRSDPKVLTVKGREQRLKTREEETGLSPGKKSRIAQSRAMRDGRSAITTAPGRTYHELSCIIQVCAGGFLSWLLSTSVPNMNGVP